MGLFYHASWLDTPDNVRALNDFIRYAQTYDGVWFVTNRQLIEWMKNPVPKSSMNTWQWV